MLFLYFSERNRDYNIVIEADTESGIPLKSEIICHSRNVAGGRLLFLFTFKMLTSDLNFVCVVELVNNLLKNCF